MKVLISEQEIQAKIAALGEQLRRDYEGESLILLGVLKGSTYFLADLSRHLTDQVEIDFVQVSSYHGEKSSSGVVQIRKDMDISIEGRHVLIVEDIVDTGLTLSHLKELLGTRKPASLRVVALLNKPEARTHPTLVDYVGFEIPNAFVVGYGLDYAERYRNLPFIAVLDDPQS